MSVIQRKIDESAFKKKRQNILYNYSTSYFIKKLLSLKNTQYYNTGTTSLMCNLFTIAYNCNIHPLYNLVVEWIQAGQNIGLNVVEFVAFVVRKRCWRC